jgi:tetrachlorobenzoquinone reductase
MTNPLQTLTVQVTDVRAEAKDVVTIEMRPLPGAKLPRFEPGSHLEIRLPNGLVRHYSLTNDWRESDRYVVAVGRAADSRGGSAFVHSLIRCGSQLAISTPRNNFRLDPKATHFRFIAGGIGITPIMAMVRWCNANQRPWTLVYAARSRQRAAFYEELCALGPGQVSFHFDDERGGFLDAATALGSPDTGEKVYCCGPGALMEAVRAAASDLPPDTVRFEWFTPAEAPGSADGAGEFEVRLRRSGLAVKVPADKSILDVLEENGIEVPYSCREGLCGTCQTNVCEGDPDHRDYVLSDEERASGKLMQICVSRSKSPILVLDL